MNNPKLKANGKILAAFEILIILVFISDAYHTMYSFVFLPLRLKDTRIYSAYQLYSKTYS